MSILRSVPVKWAFVNKPSVKFEHCYEVQVTLTDEQAKALIEESKLVDPKGKGIKLKKDDDNNYIYRFKRRVERADGTLNKVPVAVDKDGRTPFTANIGNGSVCNVQYVFVKYDHPKFGVGVTNDFKGIQVLQHVAFGEDDGEGFDNEEEGGESFSNETKSVKPSVKKESFDDGDFS